MARSRSDSCILARPSAIAKPTYTTHLDASTPSSCDPGVDFESTTSTDESREPQTSQHFDFHPSSHGIAPDADKPTSTGEDETQKAEAADGAELHPTPECRPCAWNWSPNGCINQSKCNFCHICPFWAGSRKSPSASRHVRKRRQKLERRARKAEAQKRRAQKAEARKTSPDIQAPGYQAAQLGGSASARIAMAVTWQSRGKAMGYCQGLECHALP